MREIILIGLLIVGAMPAPANQNFEIYSLGNFIGPMVTVPHECLILIFSDDSSYLISSSDEINVFFSIGQIEDMCKELGRSITEISIIIHTHPRPSPWSPGDKQIIMDLRRRGFRGPALLYCPPGKISLADF